MQRNRATKDVYLCDIIIVDELNDHVLCERPRNDEEVILHWIVFDVSNAFLWTGKKLDKRILQELITEDGARISFHIKPKCVWSHSWRMYLTQSRPLI